MQEKDPHSFNNWYDLMVNDKLLVSICGKETAEWFLKNMAAGNSTETYTLRRARSSSEIAIEDIKAVQPW